MDLTKLFQYKSSDFTYIGKRLKEIRSELKTEFAKDTKTKNEKNPFDRKNIAEMLDVSLNTITNLENKSPLTDNTIKLIHYYYTYGYNPIWILIEDNSFLNKKIIQDNIVLQSNLREAFTALNTNITSELKQFKALL